MQPTFRKLVSFMTAALAAVPASLASAAPGVPATGGRVSFGEFWSNPNGRSDLTGISDNAQYVVYCSNASNITDEDDANPGLTHCYRYDRGAGITLLMDRSNSSGRAGNQPAFVYNARSRRMLTADGRFVMFTSYASDLIAASPTVTGDNNNTLDVFIRDTSGFGSTERVSLADGQEVSGPSVGLGMSADATKILFITNVDLANGMDRNFDWDVYLYDRSTRRTKLVSSNAQGFAVGSTMAELSENGKHVAFASASNVLSNDTNGVNDIYWKDVTTGIMRLVSAPAGGVAEGSDVSFPAISSDGTRVAFMSYSSRLVAGDSNNTYDLFVKDVASGTVYRASTKNAGGQSNRPDCNIGSLSGNGRIVAMMCAGSDLVTGDNNGTFDVFIKNLDNQSTVLVSRAPNGAIGNSLSAGPVLSKDGAWVGFTSSASNLVSSDTNNTLDAFVGSRF